MKGLTERRVLYGHVFRNAMLIVDFRLSRRLRAAFFTGSLLIETIFSLDGLGYLSFESIAQPRLSGGLRQSLYFRAARSRGESAFRPHLYLDRSAHRFRDAGGLTVNAAARSPSNAQARAGHTRDGWLRLSPLDRRRLTISRPTGAASGPSGFSWRCSSLSLAVRVHRQ